MKIINTDIMTKSKFLNFNVTEYEDKEKNSKFWYWVQRPNGLKAVVIAAIVDIGLVRQKPDDFIEKDYRLVMTKEFRIPINGYEFGFPAGLVDGDETIEETARREFYEETGMNIKRIIQTSPFVFNSPGMTDESVAIVFCEAEGTPSTKNNESSEDIEVILADKNQIKEILTNKELMIGAKAWIIFNNFVGYNPFEE
jgi:ADP-ribose pyrophosphatase